MEIIKNLSNNILTITVKGRLNTITAPELETEIGELNDIKDLTFDLKDLEYISSAGLRVLLKAQKLMDKNEGKMKLINVNSSVNEVFEITGFLDILTVIKA